MTPLYVRERPTDPVAAVCATLEAAGIEFTNGDPSSVGRKAHPNENVR